MNEEAPEPWWVRVQAPGLAQGDLLDCPIPKIEADSGKIATGEPFSVSVEHYSCVIMSQSCDLAPGRNVLPSVLLCPVFTLDEWRKVNPPDNEKAFRSALEGIRQGNTTRLHLLASPEDSIDQWKSLIVDFRLLYTLPIGFLEDLAQGAGPRWRLRSPYVEHLSQAFARFFMRVGLPSDIRPFK
jgi:hypothetical protein